MSRLHSRTRRGRGRRLLLGAAMCAALLGSAVPAQATRFVYVANLGSANVSQYAVGAGGLLAPLAPATVAAGNYPEVVAVSPNNKNVYVTNQADDTVSQYSIRARGRLVPNSPSTVATGHFPTGVTVSRDGRSVYVANRRSDDVSQYDVGSGGRLSPKSPATVPAAPITGNVVVSPDGRSVYVTGSNAGGTLGRISQYDVGSGGKLSPKNPATVDDSGFPYGLAVSPDGGSVYVADFASPNHTSFVSQYDVGPEGTLSPKNPPTVAAGDFPTNVAVSPDGRSVYVPNAHTHDVSQYDVGAGGRLSPKNPPTVPAAGNAVGVAVNPNGNSVYVTNIVGQPSFGGNNISQYDVGPGGKLSSKSPPTVDTDSSPVSIAVSPLANRPPTCVRVAASPRTIFPATRQLVTVTLKGARDAQDDRVSFHINQVTQDERVTGKAAHPTFPDARFTAAGADSNRIKLRAERRPRADGRVYRIAFTVTDTQGASCSRITKVFVPLHRHKLALDSAPPSYDSFTGRRRRPGVR
jgi:DNA-binding beta-propeller fold protein YncE